MARPTEKIAPQPPNRYSAMSFIISAPMVDTKNRHVQQFRNPSIQQIV